MPDKKLFEEFLVECENRLLPCSIGGTRNRLLQHQWNVKTVHFSAALVERETGHFPGTLQQPSQQIMLRNASYQLRVERLAACLMENYQI